MSARTYVCVSCRWARRAEAAFGLNTGLRCATCSGPLWELDKTWRIPRKTNDKGWTELTAKVARDSARWLPEKHRRGAVLVTKLDGQIAGLEKQPESPKKTLRLKKLKKERTETIRRYSPLPGTGMEMGEQPPPA